jgi:hypothetical protein
MNFFKHSTVVTTWSTTCFIMGNFLYNLWIKQRDDLNVFHKFSLFLKIQIFILA